MLPGTCLSDNPPLAHPQSEEPLAKRVVDLVGAGVAKVFSLKVDLGAANVLREPVGKQQGRLAAHKSPQEVVKFPLKGRICGRVSVGLFKLVQGRGERLGNIPTAILPKPAKLVGNPRIGWLDCSARCHRGLRMRLPAARGVHWPRRFRSLFCLIVARAAVATMPWLARRAVHRV